MLRLPALPDLSHLPDERWLPGRGHRVHEPRVDHCHESLRAQAPISGIGELAASGWGSRLHPCVRPQVAPVTGAVTLQSDPTFVTLLVQLRYIRPDYDVGRQAGNWQLARHCQQCQQTALCPLYTRWHKYILCEGRETKTTYSAAGRICSYVRQ